MTRIVIIEDEKHASEALLHTLALVAPHAQVQAVLPTVQQSIAYLSKHKNADLIISDVQLSDGLSFSIFQQVPVTAPLIFTTGYDQFMMSAFACNSIDYLLKPVSPEDLQRALQKYIRLQQHFAERQPALSQFMQQFREKKRTRLLVKKGVEHVSLPYVEIVLFYTEHKLVYVVDKGGKKYIADKNLSELEEELDGEMFFRVNRQYIININYIRSFKAYERVKLQIELLPADLQHVLIVSQETAPGFRKWVGGGF